MNNVKVQNLLQMGYVLLKTAKINSWQLDVRILLSFATNFSQEKLIGYPELIIPQDEAAKFLDLINRRCRREPISHLIGKREFYSLEFKVSNKTLDPRPDSETLIDTALALFKDKYQPLRILDLGTGTGCLLLTLLKLFPNATGIGVDISPEAISIAKTNCQNLLLETRGQFLVQYWGKGLTDQFDLIISNPPYIKDREIPNLAPEVAVYEPLLALQGGEDGLDCYREIAPYLLPLLNKDGYVILECGEAQQDDVSRILQQFHMVNNTYYQDLTGRVRCIVTSN
jgi:release factor glutamine methyltransferase